MFTIVLPSRIGQRSKPATTKKNEAGFVSLFSPVTGHLMEDDDDDTAKHQCSYDQHAHAHTHLHPNVVMRTKT